VIIKLGCLKGFCNDKYYKLCFLLVEMVKKKGKIRNSILGKLEIYFLFAFLTGRLILNMDFIFNFKLLSLFFAGVYLFLIFMLVRKISLFSIVFILFLTIDSMIGTYLMAKGILGNVEFYGTIFVNFLAMIIVLGDYYDVVGK